MWLESSRDCLFAFQDTSCRLETCCCIKRGLESPMLGQFTVKTLSWSSKITVYPFALKISVNAFQERDLRKVLS